MHLIQSSLLGFTLALSALPASSTSQTKGPSPTAVDASSQAWSWMRGVPRGDRLISLELFGASLSRLSGKVEADIAWQYATRDGQQWMVLLSEVEILHCEPLAVSEDRAASVRVTVPLVPEQADRLREAAACGALRVQVRQVVSASVEDGAVRTWRVGAIEDRTQAIELSLAKEAGNPEALERPTLAAPRRGVIRSFRGTITVPVEAK